MGTNVTDDIMLAERQQLWQPFDAEITNYILGVSTQYISIDSSFFATYVSVWLSCFSSKACRLE